MIDKPQRYSEKRVSESFTAYVLFSEPLRATQKEVFEAVAEDYPGVDWSTEQIGSDIIDTREPTVSTDLGSFGIGEGKETRGMTSFIGMPGRCDIDWGPIIGKSCLIFPEGKQAVDRHTDHLGITVHSAKDNTSMAARFDAARRMTCIAAVFAKLPTCVGVYFPNGDTLVKPENWVRAAETAMKGEVPVMEWITLWFQRYGTPENTTHVSGSTVGLAAFNGHEISIPACKLPVEDVAKWLIGIVRMQIEADHKFQDSDTLGHEPGDKLFRIRHVTEGQHEAQTDQWIFLHQTCEIDEMKMFGERSNRPPPPGFDNTREGNWDSLKDQLYSFVSSGKS